MALPCAEPHYLTY